MVWDTTTAAKSLLKARRIEDPNFELRRILTQQSVTLRSCREALHALMRTQNAGPLEAIIGRLRFCKVEEALALRICGVDEAAAGALQTLREARASKRARHAAGADSDAAATHGANAARNDGVDAAAISDDARTAGTHLPPALICATIVVRRVRPATCR
jgi:hypothetical protein